eukprot:TRINITY_DN238_c0_g1_i2.p1 TRINITY_DN238_c0_g1~~TRINITY_DN238_c0_g1_i2.p1  ORF type:complete len:180 (+),score=14.49 TRINITY_DN238_c0_g1_i2:121-660(+)
MNNIAPSRSPPPQFDGTHSFSYRNLPPAPLGIQLYIFILAFSRLFALLIVVLFQLLFLALSSLCVLGMGLCYFAIAKINGYPLNPKNPVFNVSKLINFAKYLRLFVLREEERFRNPLTPPIQQEYNNDTFEQYINRQIESDNSFLTFLVCHLNSFPFLLCTMVIVAGSTILIASLAFKV